MYDSGASNITLPCILIFVTYLLTDVLVSAEKFNSRVKRAGLYPPRSGMGIYLAIALPVDLPQYELSLSYNFEANYVLPDNATELELGPQITQIRYARSITRTRVYNILEDRLEREGFIGRACLLRTICETTANPLGDHNGLLGDLLHLVFTPSTSLSEDLPKEFYDAEERGKGEGVEGCIMSYPECPLDLFSLISMWGDEKKEL